MSATEVFDVIIIGGGLAGSSLARALRDQGLGIALIEARPPAPSNAGAGNDRFLALTLGSSRIFAGLGLWSSIEADRDCVTTAIEKIHVSDRGHFGFAHLDAAMVDAPALGYVVGGRALGNLLWQHIEAQHDLTVLAPATVQAIDYRPDAAQVTIDVDGAERTLRGRLVVAADGSESLVRQQAGIDSRRHDYHQTAVVTHVHCAQPHNQTAWERFTADGPIAALPWGQGLAIVWTLASDAAGSLLALDDAAFIDRIAPLFGGRLGPVERPGRRFAHPLGSLSVAEQVRPRLAVVGNAAHTMHPVAAQGFNLGLRDVAVLAEVIVDARRAGRDPGTIDALQGYAALRRRDQRQIAGFTDLLVRGFGSSRWPMVVGRNAGLLALDVLPPVKRRLMRMAMGLAGYQTRLARGLPL